LRQRGIFSIGFVTVATAWYFFYWFLNCCDSVVFFSIGFGTVATAWYFLYFFYWFWNCYDSVVFFVFFLLVLELLRQHGIFCIFSIGFGTVATAWYFFYFFYWFLNCCDSVVFFLLVLELLRQRGIFFYWFWNCCDSVVFFVFFSIGIEKIQKRPRCRNSSKTNRKSRKNTTLSQQLHNQ
jgi:hypothetical protein